MSVCSVHCGYCGRCTGRDDTPGPVDNCLWCSEPLSGNLEVAWDNYPYCSKDCSLAAERDEQVDRYVNVTARRRLTTVERHQLAADAGRDTWDDFSGER